MTVVNTYNFKYGFSKKRYFEGKRNCDSKQGIESNKYSYHHHYREESRSYKGKNIQIKQSIRSLLFEGLQRKIVLNLMAESEQNCI